MLCALLVMASSTAAFAANDGAPTATPVGPPDTTQGAVPTPQQTGACRQAKAKSRPQLTAEQKAERKAARQVMQAPHATQGSTQGIPQAHKPRPAKLPLC
jgi:hypothetical protein